MIMEINMARAASINKELSEIDMEDGKLESLEKKLKTAIKTIACLMSALEDRGYLKPEDSVNVVFKAKKWWF